MTRTTRTRNKNYSFGCGSYKHSYNGGASYTGPYGPTSISTVDTCADSHGLPFVDSALDIVKDRYSPPVVDGQTPSGTLRGWWVNNTPYIWSLKTTYVGHSNAKGNLGNYIPSGADAAEAGARTNPSAPLVDLPVLIWELKEIPNLLRNTWKYVDLMRSANNKRSRRRAQRSFSDFRAEGEMGDKYLSWQFGVRPLLNDLRKLWDFSEIFDKRSEEVRRLHNGGLVKRTRLQKGTVTAVGRYPSSGSQLCSYDGSILTIAGYTNWTASRDVWAVCRWKADDSPPLMDERGRYALKQALGLQIDASTLWEIIPWSWLLDWCGSMGAYLDTKRNVVGGVLDSTNIMVHNMCDVTYTITTKPWYVDVVKPGETRFERKRRFVNLWAAPEFQLPFLSFRQLGILSSLVVQGQPRGLLRSMTL